ncbi:hypothetical protein ACWEOW_13415 [Monashia sp. NPDC004114]
MRSTGREDAEEAEAALLLARLRARSRAALAAVIRTQEAAVDLGPIGLVVSDDGMTHAAPDGSMDSLCGATGTPLSAPAHVDSIQCAECLELLARTAEHVPDPPLT